MMDQFEGENSNLEELVLPSGCRFNPTNSELVVYYLKRKIMGEPLPVHVIPTVDVYACNPERLPFSLFKHGKPHEWFFFSNRRKGKILTEGGYFDLSSSAREAVYERSTGPTGSRKTRELVGFLRRLDFYNGRPPAGTKSKWTIEEFRVNPSTVKVKNDDRSTKRKVSNLVVCKVINKEPPPKPEGWIEIPITICESGQDKESGVDKE